MGEPVNAVMPTSDIMVSIADWMASHSAGAAHPHPLVIANSLAASLVVDAYDRQSILEQDDPNGTARRGVDICLFRMRGTRGAKRSKNRCEEQQDTQQVEALRMEQGNGRHSKGLAASFGKRGRAAPLRWCS